MLDKLFERLDMPQDLIDKAKAGEIENLDAFNEHFEKVWISKEAAKTDSSIVDPIAKSVEGRLKGSLETAVKAGFKELGIELDPKDEDGNTIAVDKLAKIGFENAKTAFSDLKESLNKGDNEKLEQLQQQLNSVTGERDQYKETASTVTQEIETIKADHASEMKGVRVNIALESAKSRIKFKDDISDVERMGFDSAISKMKFNVDDNGTVSPLKEDGKPYFNEKGTEPMNLDDTLESLAKEYGLVKLNNGQQAPPKQVSGGGGDGSKPERKMHPAAEQAGTA